MAIIRLIIVLMAIGFAVMVWMNPDAVIETIDPTADKAKAWVEENILKSRSGVSTSAGSNGTTENSGGVAQATEQIVPAELVDPSQAETTVLAGPAIVEETTEPNLPVAASLRETSFIANHSDRPDIPDVRSATPEETAASFTSGLQAIVGGIDDNIMAVPWLVGIRVHSEIVYEGEILIATELCGGGVYNERWIVTAAHCVEREFNEIEIIAGATDLNDPLAIRRTSQWAYLHAGYERNVLREDIALIELEEPLPSYIPRAPWPTVEQALLIPQATEVTGRGFGATEEGFASERLKKVNLDVTESTLRVIRVADTEGEVKGLCQGDSGTPVTTLLEDRTFIIGMVSFTEAVPGAENCTTPGFVAGLVSLEGYVDDIDSLVNFCTAEPEKCHGEVMRSEAL